MPESAAPARRRLALLLVGIVLLAIQLRSPLVAVAPVAAEAQAGWGVTPAAFGLLTTLPLLCFGLATPLAPLAARRLGLEGAIELCLGGIVVATVLRSIDGFGVALVAAVLLGVSITLGNVLVPAIIRRDVGPRGRAAATGAYTVAINVGTMLTTIGTVPLASLLGWRAAIAAWSVLGVGSAVFWVAVLRRGAPVAVVDPLASGRFRPRLLAWMLGGAFAAQSFSYYAMTTWLPSLLRDERGFDASVAGVASSVFQLAGIAGGIGVPLLALRLRPRTILGIVGALWIALPLGLLVVPEQFVLLGVLGGAAQGAGFASIFTIIADAAGDARQTTALSAFVQTVGYLVAATAPPLIGGARQLSGGWTLPLGIVLAATLVFLLAGVTGATLAARHHHAR
ncbi:MAG: MFS transporter [Micrococcales bacterium]|nr:MFS transporter [Micrococcales bacterium]